MDLYCKKLKVHKDLCVCECGLIIDSELSYLGSSPDRIRSCTCCGKRVVEVKSLYSKRSLLPHIAAGDHIYKENGVYKLKQETKWNYQLQGEMALSTLTIGDLVIYTNKGIMVIEVEFDENLWHEMLVKLPAKQGTIENFRQQTYPGCHNLTNGGLRNTKHVS